MQRNVFLYGLHLFIIIIIIIIIVSQPFVWHKQLKSEVHLPILGHPAELASCEALSFRFFLCAAIPCLLLSTLCPSSLRVPSQWLSGNIAIWFTESLSYLWSFSKCNLTYYMQYLLLTILIKIIFCLWKILCFLFFKEKQKHEVPSARYACNHFIVILFISSINT